MKFRLLIASVLAAFAFAAQASVDVNKASQAELETVKGIGPASSRAGPTWSSASAASARATPRASRRPG